MADNCPINRRRFVKGAVSSALLMSAASPAVETPRRGGHLRFALDGGGAQDSLDPTTYYASVMFLVAYSTKSRLTEIGPDNTLQPGLAEYWTHTPDVKSWTFALRRSVTFHSGKPLHARDVVASLNLHRGPDSKSAVKSLLSGVVSIEAESPLSVAITLSEGNSDFAELLSD